MLGEIPASLGQLTKLTQLHIGSNQLSGKMILCLQLIDYIMQISLIHGVSVDCCFEMTRCGTQSVAGRNWQLFVVPDCVYLCECVHVTPLSLVSVSEWF